MSTPSPLPPIDKAIAHGEGRILVAALLGRVTAQLTNRCYCSSVAFYLSLSIQSASAKASARMRTRTHSAMTNAERKTGVATLL